MSSKQSEKPKPLKKPIPPPIEIHWEDRKETGFSIDELKEAKLSCDKAEKLGLSVDNKRKSVHSFNIEYLKKKLEESENA